MLELAEICREAADAASVGGYDSESCRAARRWETCLRREHAAHFGEEGE
jgi:hypothetical protein